MVVTNLLLLPVSRAGFVKSFGIVVTAAEIIVRRRKIRLQTEMLVRKVSCNCRVEFRTVECVECRNRLISPEKFVAIAEIVLYGRENRSGKACYDSRNRSVASVQIVSAVNVAL